MAKKNDFLVTIFGILAGVLLLGVVTNGFEKWDVSKWFGDDSSTNDTEVSESGDVTSEEESSEVDSSLILDGVEADDGYYRYSLASSKFEVQDDTVYGPNGNSSVLDQYTSYVFNVTSETYLYIEESASVCQIVIKGFDGVSNRYRDLESNLPTKDNPLRVYNGDFVAISTTDGLGSVRLYVKY